jgi:hypothetical protein
MKRPGAAEIQRGLLPRCASSLKRAHRPSQNPALAGLFSAPRETRTPTGHTAHKALNLVERVSVVSDASRFGLLEPFGWTHWTHCEQHLLPRLLPRRLTAAGSSPRVQPPLGYVHRWGGKTRRSGSHPRSRIARQAARLWSRGSGVRVPSLTLKKSPANAGFSC